MRGLECDDSKTKIAKKGGVDPNYFFQTYSELIKRLRINELFSKKHPEHISLGKWMLVCGVIHKQVGMLNTVKCRSKFSS